MPAFLEGLLAAFRLSLIHIGRCVFQSLCGILDALIGFCLFVVICEDPGTLFLQERLLIPDLFELTAIGGRLICGPVSYTHL